MIECQSASRVQVRVPGSSAHECLAVRKSRLSACRVPAPDRCRVPARAPRRQHSPPSAPVLTSCRPPLRVDDVTLAGAAAGPALPSGAPPASPPGVAPAAAAPCRAPRPPLLRGHQLLHRAVVMPGAVVALDGLLQLGHRGLDRLLSATGSLSPASLSIRSAAYDRLVGAGCASRSPRRRFLSSSACDSASRIIRSTSSLLRPRRGGDRDLLLLAGAEVLRRHVDDAVGVDVEGDLDLRHAARRRRDARQVEACRACGCRAPSAARPGARAPRRSSGCRPPSRTPRSCASGSWCCAG